MARKHSMTTRAKMSRQASGKKNPFYGKSHTKEALKKIAAHSRGKNNPMYGKSHTAAARKKISQALKRAHAKRRA